MIALMQNPFLLFGYLLFVSFLFFQVQLGLLVVQNGLLECTIFTNNMLSHSRIATPFFALLVISAREIISGQGFDESIFYTSVGLMKELRKEHSQRCLI